MHIDHNKFFQHITVSLFTFLSIVVLILWSTHNPGKNFIEHIPGMDGRPDTIESRSIEDLVNIGEHFELFEGIAANIQGAWPRFRGANYDNIYKESGRLVDKWDSGNPKILWSIEMGEGVYVWDSAVIEAYRLYAGSILVGPGQHS